MTEGRDPKKEKELDYSRERRSKAWSSDKADRKKRAQAKAMAHRAERRAASQKLGIDPAPVEAIDPELLAQELEKRAPKRHALQPISISLGEHLQTQLMRRDDQRQAALARAAARAEAEADD